MLLKKLRTAAFKKRCSLQCHQSAPCEVKKGTTTKPPETTTKNLDVGNHPQYSCVSPMHNLQASSQQTTPPTHPFLVSTTVSFPVSVPICVGQGTKETASQRSRSWPVRLQLTSEPDYKDLDTSAFPPAQPSGLPGFYSTTEQRVDWFNHLHISPNWLSQKPHGSISRF